jgi:hypothetical protein
VSSIGIISTVCLWEVANLAAISMDHAMDAKYTSKYIDGFLEIFS